MLSRRSLPAGQVTPRCADWRLVSAEPTRAGKASRRTTVAPGSRPVGNRRRAVTPSAGHAAWLPYELRDAREPPFCIEPISLVRPLGGMQNGLFCVRLRVRCAMRIAPPCSSTLINSRSLPGGRSSRSPYPPGQSHGRVRGQSRLCLYASDAPHYADLAAGAAGGGRVVRRKVGIIRRPRGRPGAGPEAGSGLVLVSVGVVLASAFSLSARSACNGTVRYQNCPNACADTRESDDRDVSCVA